MVGVWYRRKLRGKIEELAKWKDECAYIHGLTLVIKNSYTYCKSLLSPRSKVLLRMLLGERLVGVNHRAIPTSTHKEDN